MMSFNSASSSIQSVYLLFSGLISSRAEKICLTPEKLFKSLREGRLLYSTNIGSRRHLLSALIGLAQETTLGDHDRPCHRSL